MAMKGNGPDMPPLTEICNIGADLLREGIVRNALDEFSFLVKKRNRLFEQREALMKRHQTYATQYKVQMVDGKLADNLYEIENLKKFFLSEWYTALCAIDGQRIIDYYLSKTTV